MISRAKNVLGCLRICLAVLGSEQELESLGRNSYKMQTPQRNYAFVPSIGSCPNYHHPSFFQTEMDESDP